MGFSLEIIAKDKARQKLLTKILKAEFTSFNTLINRKEEDGYLEGTWVNENPEAKMGAGFYCKIWTRDDERVYARGIIRMLAQTPFAAKMTPKEMSVREDGWENLSWTAHSRRKEISYYMSDGSVAPVTDGNLAALAPNKQTIVNELGLEPFKMAKKIFLSKRNILTQKEYDLIEQEIKRLRKVVLSHL